MNSVIYIGICDDEKGTCAQLENMIHEYGRKCGIKIDVSVWYTGESLCKFLEKENTLDILYLDIQLVTTDGIKVGHFIREELENLNTAIVYISSKSDYAMSLFRMQPFDFLIKPLNQKMIDDVLERYLKVYGKKNQFFECYSKSQGKFYKVPFRDILYFYSQNKKINMVTEKKQIQFNGKLKEIVNVVPYNFCLIHQSYLINLDFVSECTYELMRMQNNDLLSISLPYRKAVREKMIQNEWEKIK